MNLHRKSLGGFRWALWLGFALAVAIPFSATKAAECSLTLGMEDWPPNLFTDSQGRPAGIDVEIIRAVTARAGCRLNFIEARWKRIIHDVRVGKMDIAVAYFKQERTGFGRFTRAHREEINALYVRKGRHGEFRDLESFLGAGLRLGIVRGVFYGDAPGRLFRSPAFKAQIEEVAVNRQNLKKLMTERIDGIVINPATAAEFMRANNAVGMMERRFVTFQTDVHFLFSKVSVTNEVVDAIDRAIEELSRDGTIAAIIRGYEE